MITLKFATLSPEVIDLEESLKDLSLAFKMEEDKALYQPILEDGELTLKGEKAIKAHLDKLSGELKQWWYCDC